MPDPRVNNILPLRPVIPDAVADAILRRSIGREGKIVMSELAIRIQRIRRAEDDYWARVEAALKDYTYPEDFR
jgi:hypothetical protein